MKEMFQFLGIKWIDSAPKFMITRDNTGIEFLDIPKQINIKKTDVKKCIGYYDLLGRTYIPCVKHIDLSNKDSSQCMECQNANGFRMCLGCNGNFCRTDSQIGKSYCDQEHIVYLVMFPDKLKVGTAAEYRYLERMYEQGAIISVAFARTPNGRLARIIEQLVSNMGIAKSVNSIYKMKNLIFNKSIEFYTDELAKELKEIRSNIGIEFSKYFIEEPKVNVFNNIYENIYKYLGDNGDKNLFMEEAFITKSYEIINDISEISGNIKAVIGGLILLEKNEKLSVINMKSWEGFIVEVNK